MKYIVTHPGPAHRDDLMVCAIALVIEGAMTINRREPTAEELKDPEVLVLDVGGRHEPELSNFDHHQLPREHEPECALTLYCKARELHDTLSLRKWYSLTTLIDSKGPYEAARVLGLPRFPFELSSPVEAALLEAFEEETEIKSARFLSLLCALGQSTIDFARCAKAEYDEALASVRVLSISGVQALLWEREVPKQSQAVRDDHFPWAAISLSHDDRGAGWSLYRLSNHPAVDFSKLEGNPAVSFAHKGGFIAKTHKRLDIDEVVGLCAQAVRVCKWQITNWDGSTGIVELYHREDSTDIVVRNEEGDVYVMSAQEFAASKPVVVD